MDEARGDEFVERSMMEVDLGNALSAIEKHLARRLFVTAAAIIGVIVPVLKLA